MRGVVEGRRGRMEPAGGGFGVAALGECWGACPGCVPKVATLEWLPGDWLPRGSARGLPWAAPLEPDHSLSSRILNILRKGSAAPHRSWSPQVKA